MNSISTQLLNAALDLSLFYFILTILSCALRLVEEVKGRAMLSLCLIMIIPLRHSDYFRHKSYRCDQQDATV